MLFRTNGNGIVMKGEKPNKFKHLMQFFCFVFLFFIYFSGPAEVGESIFKEGLAWDQTR